MKIPNETEVAVIFERVDEEGAPTTFYPKKVALGTADKKRKVFITSDGEEYSYMLDTQDQYSFGLRKTIGELNKKYKMKTLKQLLKMYTLGVSQLIFYFESDPQKMNLELVCEDDKENIYTLKDRDFESYKNHVLNKKIKIQNEPVTIKVNAKELITAIKKKIIGQDEAIEDIVSAIWENSKSKRKQNILLIGPTGVGKTEIIRIIAKELNMPLVIADAASMTQSGYVGKSTDNVLEDLLAKCNNDVKKAENAIIIIDEIDKIAANNNANNDIATTGVQNELLKLVEDGEYTIDVSNDLMKKENIIINTKNITFIAMGAFSELLKEKQSGTQEKQVMGFGNTSVSPKTKETNAKLTTDDLVKYGLKEELIGRFTNIIELKPLTKEDLISIMKNPNEELIKDKIELLNNLGIDVNIDEAVYEKLAGIAVKKKTGARGLISAVDNLFVKAMSEIAKDEDGYEKLDIDEKTIDNPKNYTLVRKKSNK